MRILLVEDNHRVVRSIKMSLSDAGYAVDTAFDGTEGQQLAEITPYDLIILDIMLPGKSGLEICQALRAQHINTPVIMLTALDDVDDRVVGLDSGADDYLVKPFAMTELLARLRALLRRDTTNKTTLLEVGDLRLDSATHFVVRGALQIELTAKEYSLLEFFMRHPNEVITREKLESHVWSYDFDGISNVIDVYLRRLRRKIDDPFEIKLFETIRGAGYRLREPATL